VGVRLICALAAGTIRHARLVLAFSIAAVAVAACGTSRGSAPVGASPAAGQRAVALDVSRTRPLGHGRAFQPPPYGRLVASAATLGALGCGRRASRAYGAHVELFAAGRRVLVPAGIGLAPPHQLEGALITHERCAYPLYTVDPTGVVRIAGDPARRRPPSLGLLFAVWGQPLSTRALAGFHASRVRTVLAYVGGMRWRGDPRAIRLARHSQIVLELGPHVDPHPVYRFPPGL
jgi:hypothetical protein